MHILRRPLFEPKFCGCRYWAADMSSAGCIMFPILFCNTFGETWPGLFSRSVTPRGGAEWLLLRPIEGRGKKIWVFFLGELFWPRFFWAPPSGFIPGFLGRKRLVLPDCCVRTDLALLIEMRSLAGCCSSCGRQIPEDNESLLIGRLWTHIISEFCWPARNSSFIQSLCSCSAVLITNSSNATHRTFLWSTVLHPRHHAKCHC